MSQIRLHTAYTALSSEREAADDLARQLEGDAPALVVLFAAQERDHRALNQLVRDRLPAGTRLIGAATAGEIDNRGFHSGSVAMAALSGDFEVGLGLGRDLSRDAMSAGACAIERACAELGTRVQDIDAETHVGLVIDDGHQYKKEELLLGALDRNHGIVLIGGGAADPGAMVPGTPSNAVVHVDGEVTDDAVLVAMFRTDAPWAALRSHAYTPTGRMLEITSVDDTHTRALQIDGAPAAARYAELLGVTVDELEFGKPRGFARQPTALRVGREYFMRSPWKPMPDGSILFSNLLDAGDELELMQVVDMADSTREFFRDVVPKRVANPSGALLFNCSGRSWFASELGVVDALGASFADAPPCAGMNVHFEIYCGFHINTTLTALVFGSDR